jgi:FxsC-like protein
MTGNVAVREAPGVNRPYFFLSYAHSDPLAGSPEADPDKLVGTFFDDLVEAVRQHASQRSGIVPGFYDQEIPVGADWKESVRHAMGAAQVFVPLYSAGYIGRSWPGREWACFRRRVELAGLDNPGRRFVPVLWTPLSGAQDPPGLREALALGADEPGYTENGLRALLKIRPYRDSYQAVVNVLAKRIVLLAEKSPIRSSEVPDIDEMESAFTSKPHLSVFAIETAAPTVSTIVPDRDTRGYGEISTAWHPFPQQEVPLAEYARQVAERLDFKAEVSGIRTVRDPRARRPGIIVIDPWFIADDNGRLALESAVADLPRWVLPLLVLDQPDDASTQKFADQVREILSAAGALPTDSSRRGAKGVSSLDEFVSTVRVLVAEAERQYLRHRSRRNQGGQVLSPPSSSRPSLRRPARPAGPAPAAEGPASTLDKPVATPDELGETPDA